MQRPTDFGQPDSAEFGRTYWRNEPVVKDQRPDPTATALDDATVRLFANNLPTLCWVANADGYIVWYNRRWHEYCGTTPEQMEGWGWRTVHDPDALPAVMDRWTASIATGAPFEMTFPLRGADGVFRPFLTRIVPVHDASGTVIRWFGVNTDVSQQQAAEEALRAADARHASEAAEQAAILGQIEEGVIVTDAAGRIVFVNEAAERLHGVKRLDVAPDAYTATYHLLTVDGLPYPTRDLPLSRAVLDGVVTLDARWRIRRPDGTEVLAIGSARPLRDAQGGQTGAVLTVRDDTDRQAAEQALLDLNRTLEARVEERTRERDRTWNNAQDMLAVTDIDGVFLEVNPAWLVTLGLRPEEVVGRSYLELVHPDDHPASRIAQAQSTTGPMPRFQNRLRHQDGTFRWIEWVAAPDGALVYAIGRDITAEKAAAEALARTEDQLRQSQKMEAVGQLTGGIAHDFNNLLTGIGGSLELLQTRVAQGRVADLDRYVAAAQGAAKRAAALTHRLLAFSRRQTLDPRTTDVNRLVSGMAELVRRTVGPAITVEVVGAGGLWTTLVDPYQLENALLNLCINARDAMPDGGRLTIETANRWLDARAAQSRELPPGQYVSLCVSDNGTGMAPDVAARAFDPFFTTKPIGLGTGLGLSMIYGFVRQSGGQARIYSEPGQGTMVCLYLPRNHAPADLPDVDPAPDVHGPARPGTVLVVDDEPTVRMLVTEVLEMMGLACIEAADGPAGLRALQSDARIDLLITDVGLPGGLNGRQVADAGRAIRPGLRVLFITGYAENAVIGNGLLDPGMQVLTKPFAMETLSNRVRAILTPN